MIPKIKVSQMSNAVDATALDVFMVVQNGVNKGITLTTLLKNLDSTDQIKINPKQSAIDFIVATKNNANMLNVKGSLDRIGVGTSTPLSKFHINGNTQIGSTDADGILIQSSEVVTYSTAEQTASYVKPISPLRTTTLLAVDASVNALFTLPNGSNGQIKTIIISTLTGTKTATVSFTGYVNNTNTITYSHATDPRGFSTTLQFSSVLGAWIVIGNNGGVLSKV